MNTLYARSVSGERLRFRPHALGVLVREGGEALRYEPWQVQDGDTIPGAITVTLLPDGFHCDAETASAIVAEPVNGHEHGRQFRLRPSHDLLWTQFPGCTDVDLTPIDRAGEIAGESVRIAVPLSASGPQVRFRTSGSDLDLRSLVPRMRANEVWVQPVTPTAGTSHIATWRRFENDKWRATGSTDAVGEAGIRLTIPQFQGAFAWVDPRGRVAFVQFFAFGRLVRAEPGDQEEFERCCPVCPVSMGGCAVWPGWVQNIIAGIEKHSQPDAPWEASASDFVSRLRVTVRHTLLGGYLPAGTDFRLGLTVEDFAAECWPVLRPIIFGGADADSLSIALENRNSPFIGEAIEWASGRKGVLAQCIRLAPIRAGWRRLVPLIPAGAPSSRTLSQLGTALQLVPSSDGTIEQQVGNLWERLRRLVEDEFGTPLENLTQESLARARWGEQLLLVAGELGVEASGDSARILQMVAARIGALSKMRIGEFLTRCRQENLLGDGQAWEEYQARGKRIRTAFTSIAVPADEKFRKSRAGEVDLLLGAAGNDTFVAAAAAVQMEESIKSTVSAALHEMASECGFAFSGQPPDALEAFLAWGLQQSELIRAGAEVPRERDRDIEFLRAQLPEKIDPQSKDAWKHLLKERQYLADAIGSLTDLATAYSALVKVPEPALKRFQAFRVAATDSPATGQDGLASLAAGFREYGEVSGIVETVASDLRKALIRNSGLREGAIHDYLGKARLGKVESITKMALRRQTLFHKPQPPLAQLLWSEKSESAEELSRIMASLEKLEDVKVDAEIPPLIQLTHKAFQLIEDRGGPEKLREHLRTGLEIRLRKLMEGHDWPREWSHDLAVLPRLLKGAGAKTYGVLGPPIEAEPLIPTGLTAEQLRLRLIESDLWPEELPVPTHGR